MNTAASAIDPKHPVADAARSAAVLLVLGFVLHYVQDRRLARVADLPGWYLPLRLRLTAVACIALIAGAFVQWPY